MNDTIAALATPPGISGLSVIRVSGDESINIVNTIFKGKNLTHQDTHTIHFGTIADEEKILDAVTISIFKKPYSYTGDNVIEIGCHGGLFVASSIINLLIKNGARIAEPGEFTKRAFINGKMDMAQVEAVADIIHSVSVAGSNTAARQLAGEFSKRLNIYHDELLKIASYLEIENDFSEEDIAFIKKNDLKKNIEKAVLFCDSLASSYKASEIFRSGYFIGIAGYPNSGKSTLFNTLLQKKRAITSNLPGTTRDYIEEILYIKDLPVRLFDTAGIRETDDLIEIEGIKFVESILNQSDMILIINDMSISENNSDELISKLKERYTAKRFVILQNKIDKINQNVSYELSDTFFISAKKEIGIDFLRNHIYDKAVKNKDRIQDILVNQRQAIALTQSTNSLRNAIKAIEGGYENEIIAIDIREAAKKLGEITGKSWSEETLNNIFSKFCIGK